MSGELLRHRWLLAAAVGAGVALGAASVFAYHQVHESHHREHEGVVQRRLDNLNRSVNEMKEEIEELKKRKKRRRRRPGAGTDTESRTDFDEDDDDEEFYDFDDEEEEEEEDDLSVVTVPSEWRNSIEKNGKSLSDFEQTIAKADPLLTGTIDEQKQAYVFLKENEHMFPDNAEYLWRLSKACISMSIIYDTAGNKEKKKQYVYEALNYAQQAVKLEPDNPEAHKWYAISVGSRSDFVATKGKIEDGFLFKQHIDTALRLNPDDGTLHYLLARFAYEVSQLSWIERQVAKTLFAEPPSASLDEAIEHCLRAEDLTERDWKENRLLCAKCYIANSEYRKAVKWLDKAAKSPVLTPDDEQAEKEVNELLGKYGSYRS